MARGEGKTPSNQSWMCRYLTQKTLDKTLTKKIRQEYLSAYTRREEGVTEASG